jgi:lipopolysaccharide transport system permease protein
MMSDTQVRQITLAIQDFCAAAKHHRIWLELSKVEVKQRYRRSVIGPWWISLSLLIFIVAMGEVYSRLFHEDLANYIPFFTAGFLMWTFISSSINESTEVFKQNASFIKQVRLPFNLYIFKHLSRQVIFLGHNLVVYILVMLFFKINPGWNILWFIPGFFLLLINVYWICLLITLLSTRYRDTAPLINSCIQIAFFITPISWMPKLIGQHSLIMKLNPFVYFLGATRNPLLGTMPTWHTWAYNITAACGGLVVTLLVFAYSRRKIPFWVD